MKRVQSSGNSMPAWRAESGRRLALIRDDEVAARASAAAERLVRGDRAGLCELRDLLGQARGDDVVQRRGLVLDLEVVERGACDDLDDGERDGVVVADHGDGDLHAGDALLDEHGAARLAGEAHGVGDLARLGHAGDTVARAVRGGLHEERKAELAHQELALLHAGDLARGERRAARAGDVRRLVEELGDVLLGAGGGAEHAGEGVGDVEDLEEALDAAVLAVAAVHGDERDVVAALRDGLDESLVGDVEQRDVLETGLAEGLHARAARIHRDLALVGPTARKDHHVEFVQLIPRHIRPLPRCACYTGCTGSLD